MLSDVGIRMDEFLDFINRCNEMFREQAEIAYEDHRTNHNIKQKKYFRTEQGIFAKRKGDYIRRSKLKSSFKDLSWEEKKLIGKFYKNCPEGYEVDHIIPISKGGKHILSNLQYLTREENRRKLAKLNWKNNL